MIKKGIFYFSSINYKFLRQRPQQLFHSLRKISQDYEIFYIDPPQMKFSSFKDASQDENVIMPIPGHLAVLGRVGGLIKPILRHLIHRKLADFDYEVKVAILASPIWEPYVSTDDFDVICYDYMDSLELYGFSERHARLVKKSDIVFTTAQKLKEELFSNYQKEAVLVSNGVDPDFFRKKSNDQVDFRKNGQTVGYVGAVYDWIDLDMIYQAAISLPDVDFVFIGPLTPLNQKKVADKPDNVHFLGKKDYEMVPAYVNLFDVTIIPFKKGDVALTTDPIKVYEYFSLGKPVVATAIHQLERFNDGQVLKMARNTAEFIDSVEYFMENDNQKWQDARKKLSEENSWDQKARKILDSLDGITKI